MPATSTRYRGGAVAPEPPIAPATAAASAPAPASCMVFLLTGPLPGERLYRRPRLRLQERAREEDRGLRAGDVRVGTELAAAAPRRDALVRELLDVVGGEPVGGYVAEQRTGRGRRHVAEAVLRLDREDGRL